MSTICWILCGLIFISLLIYFIFLFVKKVEILQYISSIFPILLTGILNLLFLYSNIPDSYHIIKISAIAFTLASITQILSSFVDNRKGKIAEGILFISSLFIWIELYKSVFYIFRVPNWINIIAGCTYLVIILLLLLIFIKKQTFLFYLFAVLSLVLVSFLHYCAFVSLCYQPANFSIVKFIGITILMGYIVFGLLNNSIINLKLKNMISFLSLFISFTLIALSNLMILN